MRQFRLSLTIAMMVLIAIGLSGCGGSNYSKAHLEGAVTVSDKPIAEGIISIVPLAGKHGSGVTGPIAAGRYSLENVPIGKVRVYLTAVQRTGKTVRFGNDDIPEKISLIPDRYREGIELEVQGERMTHDFRLTAR